MVDYKEDLEVLDAEHDPAGVQWSEKVPDGTYQARLDTARVARAKTSGRLQTHFGFEIVHGDHQGRSVDKYQGMEIKENLDYLTKDIWTMLGERISFKWKDIEKIYEKILDTIVEIKCVTDKESTIQNIWIQKKITKLSGKEKSTKPVPKDNDVPF